MGFADADPVSDEDPDESPDAVDDDSAPDDDAPPESRVYVRRHPFATPPAWRNVWLTGDDAPAVY
ncbi:MAG: hypothetical protein ACRDD1_07770, partial [Planctomycetia bacterium]